MTPKQPDLTPEKIAQARQLAELISWLFYDDRRLGLLDRCERVEGKSRNGQVASLSRHGSGWELRVNDAHVSTLKDFGEVLRAITKHGFVAERVVLAPRFADMLFQGAVEQTEAGLARYHEYLSKRQQAKSEKTGDLQPNEFFAMVLGIPIAGPFEAAVGMSALDESIRRSIAGIILAISAAEAQINEWVVALGGWSRNEDGKTLVRKMKALAAKGSRTLNTGQDPYQALQSCVDFRNDLVHPKPKERELILASPQAPGRDLSLRARQTCFLVRQTLVEIADLLGLTRPRYLAYCPAGDFKDEAVWATAVVMTGVRDDPDFPKLG